MPKILILSDADIAMLAVSLSGSPQARILVARLAELPQATETALAGVREMEWLYGATGLDGGVRQNEWMYA
jgi:hypothetical protein